MDRCPIIHSPKAHNHRSWACGRHRLSDSGCVHCMTGNIRRAQARLFSVRLYAFCPSIMIRPHERQPCATPQRAALQYYLNAPSVPLTLLLLLGWIEWDWVVWSCKAVTDLGGSTSTAGVVAEDVAVGEGGGNVGLEGVSDEGISVVRALAPDASGLSTVWAGPSFWALMIRIDWLADAEEDSGGMSSQGGGGDPSCSIERDEAHSFPSGLLPRSLRFSRGTWPNLTPAMWTASEVPRKRTWSALSPAFGGVSKDTRTAE